MKMEREAVDMMNDLISNGREQIDALEDQAVADTIVAGLQALSVFVISVAKIADAQQALSEMVGAKPAEKPAEATPEASWLNPPVAKAPPNFTDDLEELMVKYWDRTGRTKMGDALANALGLTRDPSWIPGLPF